MKCNGCIPRSDRGGTEFDSPHSDMKISLTRFLVPYDSKGNLLHDMPWGSEGDTHGGRFVWLPNNPFVLRLTILDNGANLWRKYVDWESDDGRKFPMFTGNLPETMLSSTLLNGRTGSLTWVVRKHGRQFGIVPYLDSYK